MLLVRKIGSVGEKLTVSKMESTHASSVLLSEEDDDTLFLESATQETHFVRKNGDIMSFDPYSNPMYIADFNKIEDAHASYIRGLETSTFKAYRSSIKIGFLTICEEWDNQRYRRFLQNLMKNVPCKFTFVSEDGATTWVYKDHYIYFSVYDCGVWYDTYKLFVNSDIVERLQEIPEELKKEIQL